MNYSKRNRVTDFPLCSVFSHGLDPKQSLAAGDPAVGRFKIDPNPAEIES